MAIAKKLYFDMSWIDMCHELSFEQVGVLMRNFMDYSAGLLVSDLSSVDSYLASCWATMKEAIDVDKAHREAVSAARKVAGSLGGKKRALNFHRPKCRCIRIRFFLIVLLFVRAVSVRFLLLLRFL